jgi:hypothetical protein
MAPVPDGMPVLSRGKHRNPARGACFMEYTALLAGEPFSDAPLCVDRELAAVLRHANDTLSDADRPRLLPLLGRAVGLVVRPPAPLGLPVGAPDVTVDLYSSVVAPFARTIAALHQQVSSRFTAALGVELTPAEERRFDGGRDVDPLFWHLMDRPQPLRTSAAWVDRLVGRLDLLHRCYEAVLTELGLTEPGLTEPGLRPAAAPAPAPAPPGSCASPADLRTVS